MIVHIFCAIKCVFLFIPSNPVRRFCANRLWRYPILQTQRRHFMSFAYIQLFSRLFRCYLRSCNLFKTFCHCSSVLLTAAYIRRRPSVPTARCSCKNFCTTLQNRLHSFLHPCKIPAKSAAAGKAYALPAAAGKECFRPADRHITLSIVRSAVPNAGRNKQVMQ